MDIRLPYPQPKQKEFLAAKSRYVAFGGARGGGKSFAVRLKAVVLGLRYQGIKMLLVRRTYPELLENHIKPLAAMTAGYAKYRDTDKTLTFLTGSTLKFGYCDTDNDVLQYQGQEFDVIFIDEATQLTEYQYDCIRACMRGVNDFPKRMYLTCNPGGVGHGWVKRLFVDRDYTGDERPEDYTFIKSRVYDNHALMDSDPDYVRTLETLPADLRKAWLDGEWDLFAGQYFSEWRRDVHVMDSVPEIPAHWTRVIAMDYGLDMLAVVWAAFDTDGRGIVYKELCRSDLPVQEAADAIREACTADELTKGRVEVYAPPDLWARSKDTGKSIEELFRERDVWFIKADNNRVSGWMNLHDWLRKADDGIPWLRFTPNCSECIRCIPLLQYAKNNSLDCATDPHDITHAPDAVRYLVQSRPRRGQEPDTRSSEEKMIDDFKEKRFHSRPTSGRIIHRS